MKTFENLDEISDLGFESSPLDHDQSPTTVNSTHNGSSFAYCRTNSETSGFSEQLTDDFNSYSSDTNSPRCWPATGRSPYRPTLSRFGGMKHKVNDQKPTDLGEIFFFCNSIIG